MKILVVDDEKMVRDCLSRLLAHCGHDIRIAANGLEALRRVEDEVPDVVISDVQMPGVGGMDLLVSLHVLYPRTPVVLMSGNGIPEGLRGVAAFLKKPFEFETLRDILEALEKKLSKGNLMAE